MQVTAGMRLKSAVSSTEVVVVRPPSDQTEITCGGVPMFELDQASPTTSSGPNVKGQSLLGKRYVDDMSGIELLCTRGGSGVLACDGRVLAVQKTKPLPSSD